MRPTDENSQSPGSIRPRHRLTTAPRSGAFRLGVSRKPRFAGPKGKQWRIEVAVWRLQNCGCRRIIRAQGRGSGGNEKPNRHLGGFGCARCRRLENLHLSDSFESPWYGRRWAGAHLSDLPNRNGRPTPARLLLRPHYKCRNLCTGRCRSGNHAAVLPHSL